MWTVLVVIAAISMLVFWRGPNAVWGGITFGAIGGFIVAVISALSGSGFHWTTIGKGMIIGILVGLVFELPSKLSYLMKKKTEEE